MECVVVKMKTKTKYITSVGIAFIIGIMATLGVDIVDNDEGYLPYTCDKETVDDMMCYKLSRVGKTTGVNYYCYYNRDDSRKAKACSTGWKKLLNVDEYEPEKSCPEVTVVAYVDNGETGERDKYICNDFGKKADCKEFTLEMPFEE